jgi:small GTP-binding protein
LKVVKLEPSTLVNTNGNQVSVKAVVVGDAAVGKTCLLQAVLQLEANQNNNNANQNHYITTMRADGKDITFNLYDTSGQDESDRSRMNVYDGTDIFLLCFSIISPYSFENIRTKWIPEITRYAAGKPIILVGCKQDLRTDPDALERLSERQLAPVSFDQGFKMKGEINARCYIETSSFDPVKIHQLIENILDVFLPSKKKSKKKKIINVDIVVDKKAGNIKSSRKKDKDCSVM